MKYFLSSPIFIMLKAEAAFITPPPLNSLSLLTPSYQLIINEGGMGGNEFSV